MNNFSSNTPVEDTHPPTGFVDPLPTMKDEGARSPSENGKRPRERSETDSILSDEAAGMKKAEAVVLAWSRNAVWAVYAW